MNGRYRNGGLNWGELSPRLQPTLTALVDALIKPECLKRDLFFALLLIAMEDNEFLLQKEIGETTNIVNHVQQNRTDRGTINEAILTLNRFPEMPVKVIACPLNDVTLIIATIPQIFTETYSICVKINEYILTSEFGMPMSFANLEDLFSMFKDKIVVPVKSTVLNYHKYPSGNLSGLPDDLLYKILLKLPVKDVLNLSEACKRIRKLVTEDSFWWQMKKRDFSDTATTDVNNWQIFYKDMYLANGENTDRLARLRSYTLEEIEDGSAYSNLRAVDSRWEVIL